MSEYKRLTGQKWTDDIDLTKEYGYSYIYKRLYELEDKIENGTLLELPCKVGDKVYEIEYNCWEVCHDCPHFSTFFGMDENCDIGYETYPNPKKLNANCKKHELQLQESIFSIEFYARHFNDFGKIVFTTKAEAEAKLKELRGEV